jgi:beta-lactamase regulating signal transducer with metallopeptidase domain
MNALTWLEPGTVSALGWTLVHFLWQGAAAALLVAVANAALRGRSPRARYEVALVALLAMLALPVVTFVAVRDTAPATAPGTLITPTPVTPIPTGAIPALPAAGGRTDPATLLPGLVVFWAAGVLLLSLRTMGGWALVWRLRRSGRLVPGLQEVARALARRMRLWRPVRVCESLLVEVPTAMGWIKPMILLPPATLMSLSPAQLELVLAHELAHIRRWPSSRRRPRRCSSTTRPCGGSRTGCAWSARSAATTRPSPCAATRWPTLARWPPWRSCASTRRGR